VLLGGPAVAQDSYYIGVGVGSFDYRESFVDSLYGRVDDSVTTYELFGGFEFNEHVALEISYRTTDDIMAVGSATVAPFGLISGRLTSDFSMTSLVGLGQIPFEWGALIGGLGYFSSENDFREDLMADTFAPFVSSGSYNDDGLTAALGIEWRFGRFGARYGVRLEYEWWDIDAAEASAIGVGFSYGF
jgi:hypothetical protein